MSDDILGAVSRYHWADLEAQTELARILVPGTTQSEVESAVDDVAGSSWDRLEQERLGPLEDTFDPALDPPAGTPAPQQDDALSWIYEMPTAAPADDQGAGARDAD